MVYTSVAYCDIYFVIIEFHFGRDEVMTIQNGIENFTLRTFSIVMVTCLLNLRWF